MMPSWTRYGGSSSISGGRARRPSEWRRLWNQNKNNMVLMPALSTLNPPAFIGEPRHHSAAAGLPRPPMGHRLPPHHIRQRGQRLSTIISSSPVDKFGRGCLQPVGAHPMALTTREYLRHAERREWPAYLSRGDVVVVYAMWQRYERLKEKRMKGEWDRADLATHAVVTRDRPPHTGLSVLCTFPCCFLRDAAFSRPPGRLPCSPVSVPLLCPMSLRVAAAATSGAPPPPLPSPEQEGALGPPPSPPPENPSSVCFPPSVPYAHRRQLPSVGPPCPSRRPGKRGLPNFPLPPGRTSTSWESRQAAGAAGAVTSLPAYSACSASPMPSTDLRQTMLSTTHARRVYRGRVFDNVPYDDVDMWTLRWRR
ncbi:unnamed protein product [Vitrella brassicaformis CCMP3155]|uniref:Uncharacterized protein n=1 Tax=Vitrella brassicaformis (strain CCMP3155) TaxID=1169540 RepID=A0A0G4GCD6_VITBC|nr:unnamed protein product [Vitrella brassicaformis CCMP3155]|eukprot:CEM26926.1 unnamed protein product [Vitrella brassicaformis CCMP3155]